jgi:hypothetical protein
MDWPGIEPVSPRWEASDWFHEPWHCQIYYIQGVQERSHKYVLKELQRTPCLRLHVSALWGIIGLYVSTETEQDGQCTYNVILSAFENYCCRGKAKNITYSCVCARAYPGAWTFACAWVHVALLIQHATSIRRIMTSFVAPLAPPYFSSLSLKRHNFIKNVFNLKCVFWFSLQVLFEHFLIVRRIQRDIVINVKQ